MSEKSNYPTRKDAERLSEIGMFISGYLERPDHGPYLTREHKETLVKIFKFIFMFVELKEGLDERGNKGGIG